MKTVKNQNQVKESKKIENDELSALMDKLNASSTIVSIANKRNYSTERIWLKSFRDAQGGKISNSHRTKLAKLFGEIANFVKAGKFDLAKQRFELLKNWAEGKLVNLDFDKFENYSNKDIVSNPNLLNHNSEDYHLQSDCINQGIISIKILKQKELI